LSETEMHYNANNSYFASASLRNAVGAVRFGRFTERQKFTIERQAKKAEELGLKSRYWDTPSWPVSWRNIIWECLVELGVDFLNVDDLIAAALWDWKRCVVGGLNLCA
jgi:hypothetical protein